MKREMLKGNIINQYYMTKANCPQELHSFLITKADAVQYTPVKILPFWAYPPVKISLSEMQLTSRSGQSAAAAPDLNSQSAIRRTNNPSTNSRNDWQFDSGSRNGPVVQVVIQQQGGESLKTNLEVDSSCTSSSESDDSEYEEERRRRRKERRRKERMLRKAQISMGTEDGFIYNGEEYVYVDKKASSTCNLL